MLCDAAIASDTYDTSVGGSFTSYTNSMLDCTSSGFNNYITQVDTVRPGAITICLHPIHTHTSLKWTQYARGRSLSACIQYIHIHHSSGHSIRDYFRNIRNKQAGRVQAPRGHLTLS
jgi:hypothetical protein